MAVSFDQIPAGYRRPGTYIEVNASLAERGTGAFPLRCLILAQKDTTGTLAVDTPTRINSVEDAVAYAGAGSPAALMAAGWFAVNQSSELDLCLVADKSGSPPTPKSVGLTVTGTGLSGTLAVYIGGTRYAVDGVGSNAVLATRVAAEVNSDPNSPVSAIATADAVSFTGKVPGVTANGWNVRHSLQVGENTPRGITIVIAEIVAPTLDPDVAAEFGTAVASWGDTQYDIVANQFHLDAQQEVIASEMATRDNALAGTAGIAFSCATGTAAELTTLGNGLNSRFLCVVGVKEFSGIPYVRAASVAAIVALYGSADPARPFQSIELPGQYTPEIAGASRLTNAERALLLHDGISTVSYDANDVPSIERLITTSQTNAAGAESAAFLDVNLVLLLSYFRKAWTTRVGLRFPRHKLAADGGTPPSPGSSLVTPNTYKANAVAFYAELVTLGICEDEKGFAANSTFEINASDPNRLDVVLAPNFVNQLRVNATLLQFRL